jgi:hypothetical protein
MVQQDPYDTTGVLRLYRFCELAPGQRMARGWIETERVGEGANTRFRGWIDVDHTDLAAFEAGNRGADAYGRPFRPGTYELCGPLVRGDLHGFGQHVLVPHWSPFHESVYTKAPAMPSWDSMLAFFRDRKQVHGLVWYHQDGEPLCSWDRRDMALPPIVPAPRRIDICLSTRN